MQIIVADPCGFCYGVKRAIDIAQMNVKGYNTSIATLGEIVHNPRVVESLAQKGVQCKETLADFSAGDTVIFRSHGAAPQIYEEAEQKDLRSLMPLAPMCGKHKRQPPPFPRKVGLSSSLGRSVILRCKVSRLGQVRILWSSKQLMTWNLFL